MKKLSLLAVMVLTMAGCQSTGTYMSPKTAMQEKPVVIDSDNDGVNDTADLCPKTPENVVVDKNGCPPIEVGIGLKMEGRIFYSPNQTAIPKQAFQISPADSQRNYWQEVTNIAKKWHEYPNATIHIEGHASKLEGKSDTERMQLSKLRASIVKYTLIHQLGGSPSKVFAVGYGTHRPIADDTEPSERKFNRRVYILVSETSQDNPFDKQGNPKLVPSDGEIAD